MKIRWKHLGIKVKLNTMFILMIMISNISLGVFVYMNSRNELVESTNAMLFQTADTVAAEVGGFVQKELALLRGISELPLIYDENIPLEDKMHQAVSIARKHPEKYIDFIVGAADGSAIMSNGILIDGSNEDSYKTAKQGKTFIGDPVYSELGGAIVLVVGVPVYNPQSKITGNIAAILLGNTIQTITEGIDIGYGKHPAIINMKTGAIIGDSETGEINARNIQYQNMLKRICAGERGSAEYIDSASGGRMVASFCPIGNETEWAVLCAGPYDYYFSGLKHLQRIICLVVIVSVIIAFFLGLLVVHGIIHPLHILKEAFANIASGHADLTQRIETPKMKDEVSEVVDSFNEFASKLHGIVTNIKGGQSELQESRNSLQSITQATTSDLAEVINHIQSVSEQTGEQSKSVEVTTGVVKEIVGNIKHLEEMIENQVAGVTEASSAVEQMIGNIGSVQQSVTKLVKSFQNLNSVSSDGMQKQTNMYEKIKEIEEQSEMLKEANSVIKSIAEQTNLLAMNAAIEAAHAGEAGKGFSVVADEIRKLSETSTVQSNSIGVQLESINKSIEEVVKMSDQSREAFTHVSMNIVQTDELAQQINNAMIEQEEGSKQIGVALGNMNDSTLAVRTASQEMTVGSQAILAEVKNLQDATHTINESVKKMETGAKKISESSVQLAEVVQSVDSSVTEIGQEVDLFTV